MASLEVKVEFAGGAELLFNNIRNHTLKLPAQQSPTTIRDLIKWIKVNMLKERPEFFVQGDTVRPGILVLINDTDWELLGQLEYEVQAGDSVVFISTLHGG